MTTAPPQERDLVMVIDDDPDIRIAMELVLEGSGYAVVCAPDAGDALRQLGSGARIPCMILLDLRMPGMDVQDFRAAQLRDADIAGVPVVVLSGDADIATRAQALGVHRFVMKPVEVDRLLEEIGRYCTARP